MKAIDGDSHFIEPLDLFERYIDPLFRDRALRVEADQTGTLTMVVDRKPMRVGNAEQLLGAVVGYGEKEFGHTLRDFDAYKFKCTVAGYGCASKIPRRRRLRCPGHIPEHGHPLARRCT